MDADANGSPAQATNRWVVLGILIGFPLVQVLVAGRVIEWGQASFGRGWFPFFIWIVLLEWALFAFLLSDLRRAGLTLGSVGVPRISRREGWVSVGVGVLLMTIVAVVGDSTSARIVDGPWILPRLVEEKLFMLLVAVTAGVCEETIFRGYLFHGLRDLNVGAGTAVLLSTLSFVLIHGLEQPIVLVVFRACVGLVFAGLYAWSGSLRLPIALHIAFDAQLALSW